MSKISEFEGAVLLKISPELLRWCTSYSPKKDKVKLQFEEKDGVFYFNKKELESFNRYLSAPWPKPPKGTRPTIPKGIQNETIVIPESYYLYATSVGLFIEFIYWLMLLNFLVAAINFLPLHPFDGGRISKIIFAPYIKGKKSKKEAQEQVAKIFKIIILGLFLINALPLFF